MILNLGSLAFNAETQTPGGSPAWGTELGQGEGYKFVFEDMSDFFTGMVYRSVVDTENVTCPLGKGGNQRDDYDFVIASLFDKVYVNGKRVNNARFLLLVVKKLVGEHHVGRRTIKYNPRMTYRGEYVNEDCYRKIVSTMGWAENAAWFVYEIFIKNQDELHFTAFELGEEPQSYRDNDARKNAFLSRLPKDGKRPYEIKSSNDQPLQQIFYGAPGTGKSHIAKKKTEGKSVIRTTFHPDSDYSTFVGAYKPAMKSSERIYTTEELTVKLKEIKNSGTPYPCHKFSAKYWESLKDLSAESIKKILSACGFTESMNVEVSKGVAIGQEYLNNPEDGKIIYTFCPQAFTEAYVKAWKLYAEAGLTDMPSDPKEQYLIIEEINRGNCAQIFGDLFQLLDRGDEGYSDYYIKADKDLRDYLKEQFKNLEIHTPALCDKPAEEISRLIKEGEILLLPNNLYIWATMNTSDQSLFPIDSAFKRRWDWKYMPIADESKGWIIEIGKNTYDWWTFLDKINHKIEEATYSEDKKLGYFFCKAKDGVIDAKKFVGKVLFYLWNDVFKDTDFADSLLKDEDGKKSFDKFYTPVGQGNAEVEISRVIEFMKRAEVEPLTAGEDTTEEEDEDGNTSTSEGRNYDKFSVNGEGRYGKNRLPSECMKKYIELHPDMSVEQVYAEWKKLGDIVPHFIESKEVFDARTDNSKRSVEIACGNSVIYVAKNGYGSNGKIDEFILAVNNANWGITLAKES